MKLQSGHVAESLEGEELTKLKKDFAGYKEGLVRLSPGGWLLTPIYKKFADKLYNFKFKSSDVIVMTYPKCGTTWMQEIVWTLRNNPDLNHPMAKLPVNARALFLDRDIVLSDMDITNKNPIMDGFKKLCPDKNPDDGIAVQMVEAAEDPRTIKLHLPFSLMSPSMIETAKVIYVARDPRDVITSYLHHSRLLKRLTYTGNLEDFVKYFVDDDLLYSPYWLHLEEAWKKRDHPNMHIVYFEDLKANPMEELRKLNNFLNTNLTEQQLENIAKYISFKEMKVRFAEGNVNTFYNDDVFKKDGGFLRKGEAGDYKSKFTHELEAKVDQWITEHLSHFGSDFKYSL